MWSAEMTLISVVLAPVLYLVLSTFYGRATLVEIEIMKAGVAFRGKKETQIPWNQMSLVVARPLPGDAGFAVLSFGYKRAMANSIWAKPLLSPRKGNRRRDLCWRRMTVPTSVVERVATEIQQLRQTNDQVTPVTYSRPKKGFVAGLSAMLLGLYLLLHGAPLLVIASKIPRDPQPTPSIRQTQKPNLLLEQLQPIVRRYFHSETELRRAYLTVGYFLTILGGVLYIAGFIIPRRQDSSTTALGSPNWLTTPPPAL